MNIPCEPCEARRVLLAELERARIDHSSLPPDVLAAVVWRIVIGASTVAHAVQFFEASERCRAAESRGEISRETAMLIMRQLGERQRGAAHGGREGD